MDNVNVKRGITRKGIENLLRNTFRSIKSDLDQLSDSSSNNIYIAKAEVLFSNTNQTTIVTLPTDAVVWNIGLEVVTAFDSDGTNYLDIGTTSSGNRYIDNRSIAVTNFVQHVEGFTMSNIPDSMSGSTNITFQYSYGGSAPTQGQAFVYIHYSKH